MDYRAACAILGINRARGLESAKQQARIVLGAIRAGTTLRREVAARVILATTPAQALARYGD